MPNSSVIYFKVWQKKTNKEGALPIEREEAT